ncbi:MAG: N-acyl-D-amino-acid deacylase family protein [Gemmatimonadaceae bacterium]
MTQAFVRGALLVALGGACSRQPPQTAADPRILAGRPAAPDAAARTGPAEYDIVIRNGRVLDGAGNPWIGADVAIKDGKFAKVGTVTARGAREIDARGLYVSPGWIDVMDQSGGVLRRNGLAENKLKMGVTTAIGGEGGFPVSADSIDEYFSTLEQQGISINFGSYYSQTQARTRVMGMSAAKPNATQLEGMKASMDTAMRAGAFGMTTALIYPPSSFTTTDELVEVAKVAAKYGGIYASHIRGEGKEVVTSVREVIEIAERAGLPGEVFHLKVAYRPGWGVLMDSVRQAIESARGRGIDVAADMYVYTAGGTGLEATVPSWAFEGGRDSLVARLARPDVRTRLKQELQTGSPGWWNIIEAAGGWDGVVLANARNPASAKYHGRSLTEIARDMGKDPADAAWDLVMQGAGRVTAIYHMMSEGDIETALKFPWTSIGSDAGAALTLQGGDDIGLPHPRAYGNHVRVIARYVKERGTLTLEQAVRKMTSWPATRFRLANRGSIGAGNWADVTIFNLETLNDQATYQSPLKSPTGVEYVLVNGALTIDRGQHTNAKAGHVLYGPGRTTK